MKVYILTILITLVSITLFFSGCISKNQDFKKDFNFQPDMNPKDFNKPLRDFNNPNRDMNFPKEPPKDFNKPFDRNFPI
jgi:hypothetical protein